MRGNLQLSINNEQLRNPPYTMEKEQKEDSILYRLAAELVSYLYDLDPEEEE